MNGEPVKYRRQKTGEGTAYFRIRCKASFDLCFALDKIEIANK